MSEKTYLKDLDRIDTSKFDCTIKAVKDISYINDYSIEHKLDIHYKSNQEYKPIIVNIHGGGFISGLKKWIFYLLIILRREALWFSM